MEIRRSSYLHNGIPYTCKMSSLNWTSPRCLFLKYTGSKFSHYYTSSQLSCCGDYTTFTFTVCPFICLSTACFLDHNFSLFWNFNFVCTFPIPQSGTLWAPFRKHSLMKYKMGVRAYYKSTQEKHIRIPLKQERSCWWIFHHWMHWKLL